MRELNFVNNTKPILYLVATPIGNLGEITERAKEVLSLCDFIACEDTRVTIKLLNHLGIKKPVISCHEHNENEASVEIIEKLKTCKTAVYVSDAGTPGISDPGEKLVKHCLEAGIKVSPISGPSAGINALIASGLETSHYYFHGFLPVKQSERQEVLRELYPRKETMIFYEAPHRIDKTLKDLYLILGKRKACIARELTKIHEEFIRGDLEEFAEIDPSTLIGEMVIVVEGNKIEVQKEPEPEEIIKVVNSLVDMGMSVKDAIKKASEMLNLPKNKVYSLYHAN